MRYDINRLPPLVLQYARGNIMEVRWAGTDMSYPLWIVFRDGLVYKYAVRELMPNGVHLGNHGTPWVLYELISRSNVLKSDAVADSPHKWFADNVRMRCGYQRVGKIEQ